MREALAQSEQTVLAPRQHSRGGLAAGRRHGTGADAMSHPGGAWQAYFPFKWSWPLTRRMSF